MDLYDGEAPIADAVGVLAPFFARALALHSVTEPAE